MIRWTTEAAEDFQSIRIYIEADNSAAADFQSGLIVQAVEQLESFPKSGRKSDAVRLRQWAVPGTPYIIFYRVRPEAIIIVRILHGAMRRPGKLR